MQNGKDSDKDDFFDLSDIKYYKTQIEDEIGTVCENYVDLVVASLRHLCDIFTDNKLALHEHIMVKAVDVINTTFSVSYLYTRNLDAAFNQVKHGIVLYGEFVRQISDEKYNQIQLSVRDATLFVYRKTIYRITPELKKCVIISNQDEKFHSVLSTFQSYLTSYIAYEINCAGSPVADIDIALKSWWMSTETEEWMYELVQTLFELTERISDNASFKTITETLVVLEQAFEIVKRSPVDIRFGMLKFCSGLKRKYKNGIEIVKFCALVQAYICERQFLDTAGSASMDVIITNMYRNLAF